MIDTTQPTSVAASVIEVAVANPNPTPIPLITTASSVAASSAESYKIMAQGEIAKIKASMANLESHLANIPGDVSDEVMGAVKKLDSYAKNTTIQSWAITGAIVAFILIEIVKKFF